MKIGEAHRTQSSFLYSATRIGTPMHPAPTGVADRTQKKIIGALCLVSIAYWRGDIGAPIYWRTEAPCVGRYHTEATSPTQLLALQR
jgi:hypothetical protein